MNRRISKLTAAAAVAALVAVAPATALAETVTPTGTITGDVLSLTPGAAPTFAATLDGTDKAPAFTLPMLVSDLTGTGAGWNVTLTSTQFSPGGATPRTLAADASTITGATAACTAGATCTLPANLIGYPLGVPAAASAPAAVKIFNAGLDKGMGKIDVEPSVAVAIPANAYAGTYTSTLTVASVSAP
jgi:hypothetical protein